jgi:hypothetical protein
LYSLRFMDELMGGLPDSTVPNNAPVMLHGKRRWPAQQEPRETGKGAEQPPIVHRSPETLGRMMRAPPGAAHGLSGRANVPPLRGSGVNAGLRSRGCHPGLECAALRAFRMPGCCCPSCPS